MQRIPHYEISRRSQALDTVLAEYYMNTAIASGISFKDGDVYRDAFKAWQRSVSSIAPHDDGADMHKSELQLNALLPTLKVVK